MMDMGKKISTGQPIESHNSDKEKISYPSFSLSGDKIPDELANAKVGETCHLDIIVKKVSDSIDTYGDGEPRVEVEIRKLAYKGSKVNADEYKKMSSEEKDMADEKEVMEDMDSEDNDG